MWATVIARRPEWLLQITPIECQRELTARQLISSLCVLQTPSAGNNTQIRECYQLVGNLQTPNHFTQDSWNISNWWKKVFFLKTALSLYSYNIKTVFFFKRIKIDAAKPEMSAFSFHTFLHFPQCNTEPTFPTVQHKFTRRLECVMLVAANVDAAKPHILPPCQNFLPCQ